MMIHYRKPFFFFIVQLSIFIIEAFFAHLSSLCCCELEVYFLFKQLQRSSHSPLETSGGFLEQIRAGHGVKRMQGLEGGVGGADIISVSIPQRNS